MRAGSAAEARELLGPDFPETGVVVPGPEEGIYWALQPLIAVINAEDIETKPLTLVIMPTVEDLQSNFYCVSCGGFMIDNASTSTFLALRDSPLAAAIREIAGPVVVVPVIPDDNLLLCYGLRTFSNTKSPTGSP